MKFSIFRLGDNIGWREARIELNSFNCPSVEFIIKLLGLKCGSILCGRELSMDLRW